MGKGIIKHGNWQYSAGLPLDASDAYWSQDKIRDLQYLSEMSPFAFSQQYNANTGVISGGVVTQGAGVTVNITACVAFHKEIITIPDSFASIPPTTTTADKFTFVEAAAQTNLVVASGATTKYIKLKHKNNDGNTRSRLYGTGTYAYETINSYEFVIDAVAPTDYEVALASYTESGGVLTITSLIDTVSSGKIASKNYVDSASIAAIFKGHITGGILYNSTTTPPYIKAGSYHVNNVIRQFSANTATSLSMMIGDQTLRNNFWYWVMIDDTTNAAIQMACGGTYVKSYTINSISGGNTINVTGSAGGTQPAFGMVAVIAGATTGSNNGFWSISSVGGSPVTSIVVNGTLTNQVAVGGTVKVYYAMETYHGTNVLTGYLGNTGNTAPQQYTPSMLDTEVGWSAYDHAAFLQSQNGYYSLVSGYTNYRIIGAFCVNNSGVIQDIISYKHGKNKNDNFAFVYGYNGIITNAVRFLTISKLWGNDYVYTDDGTNGNKITFKRYSEVSSSLNGVPNGASFAASIELNGTNTINSVPANALVRMFASGANYELCGSFDGYPMKISDYIKAYSTILSNFNSFQWKTKIRISD